MSRNKAGNKEYIIEFYRVGGSVKVSAIDPDTGIEAVIVGSPKASDEELKQLALRKLQYVMQKNTD